MKNVFLFLLIFFNILNAVDLTSFDIRQAAIKEVKELIQKEEQISRAYEKYLIESYTNFSKFQKPTSIDDLKTSSYLGTSFTLSGTYYDTISLSTTVTALNNSLKTDLKNDSYISSLYQSNTFRKNTFYANSKVNFILEDDFAKHILYLIINQGSAIQNCTISGTKYCITNNHIYIYDSTSRTNKLMYYYKDKFKTGPIIITDNTSLQSSSTEFDFIPRGVTLYDENGIKYIKTHDGIEAVQ